MNLTSADRKEIPPHTASLNLINTIFTFFYDVELRYLIGWPGMGLIETRDFIDKPCKKK